MWTLSVLIFPVLWNQCFSSDVVRVLAVTGPGSSQVRAIVPPNTDPFIPVTKARPSMPNLGDWKRNDAAGIRRMGYSSKRNDDFVGHIEQSETQRRNKQTSPPQYTIKHVYIVKMMPPTVSSEEIMRETQSHLRDRQPQQSSSRPHVRKELGSHREETRTFFDLDSVMSGSRHRHNFYGERDFHPTFKSKDHFLSESRQRPTQIIVLPPPIHPTADSIKNHETAQSSHHQAQTSQEDSNSSASSSSKDSRTSGNGAGPKEGKTQTWKAHPEVYVFKSESTRRPLFAHSSPTQMISYGNAFGGNGPLSLEYYV